MLGEEVAEATLGEVDLAQLDAQWVQRLYAILDLGRRLVVALSASEDARVLAAFRVGVASVVLYTLLGVWAAGMVDMLFVNVLKKLNIIVVQEIERDGEIILFLKK